MALDSTRIPCSDSCWVLQQELMQHLISPDQLTNWLETLLIYDHLEFLLNPQETRAGIMMKWYDIMSISSSIWTTIAKQDPEFPILIRCIVHILSANMQERIRQTTPHGPWTVKTNRNQLEVHTGGNSKVHGVQIVSTVMATQTSAEPVCKSSWTCKANSALASIFFYVLRTSWGVLTEETHQYCSYVY